MFVFCGLWLDFLVSFNRFSDSNGNYRNIGMATSDASGMFSLSWMPDISGDFTVYARFAGSKGYFGSFAETSFTAVEAAPTAEPVVSSADLYFVPAVVGIVVAIIIVGAMLAVLLLRKRP